MLSLSRRWAIAAAIFASISHSSSGVAQDTRSRASGVDPQLIQELKREVMEELLKSDFLQKQIELGIKNYLKDEQAAKTLAAADLTRRANEKVAKVRPVTSARDHVYGNPNAPISLIEYSDFECPFCKKFHLTPKEIVNASGGKVNLVYRHFPLGSHNPGAQKQAEAAECANALGGNDAFWKYADAIYARTRSNGRGFPISDLTPLAKELGLPAARFQECVDKATYGARVQEDMLEGATIGLTGTPSTIIFHNKTREARLKLGAQAAAAFKADIEAMLK
jgi:protein-disulfide isomerase